MSTQFQNANKIKFMPLPYIGMFDLDVIYQSSDAELLYQVLYKLNEIAKSQNIIIDNFQKVIEWANEQIETYTKEQLQEWLQDGTLSGLINQYLFRSKVSVYNTVADMISDDSLIIGVVCQTLGYYNTTDMGGAYWVITATMPTNYYVSLTNGLYASIVRQPTMYISQFGASYSNPEATYNAITSMLKMQIKNIMVPGYTYQTNGNITIDYDMSIIGCDERTSRLTMVDDSDNLFTIGNTASRIVTIENVNLWTTDTACSPSTNTYGSSKATSIVLNKAVRCKFVNVKINRFNYGVYKGKDATAYSIDFIRCAFHQNNNALYLSTTQAVRIFGCSFDGNLVCVNTVDTSIGNINVLYSQIENSRIGVYATQDNGDLNITGNYFDNNYFRSIIYGGDKGANITNNVFLENRLKTSIIDCSSSTGYIYCCNNLFKSVNNLAYISYSAINNQLYVNCNTTSETVTEPQNKTKLNHFLTSVNFQNYIQSAHYITGDVTMGDYLLTYANGSHVLTYPDVDVGTTYITYLYLQNSDVIKLNFAVGASYGDTSYTATDKELKILFVTRSGPNTWLSKFI